MDFFTSNRFDILLGVVIALCSVLAEFLEAQYSPEEKREFARTLNRRWFEREGIRSPISIFKAVFDNADSLLSKVFGSKILSLRSISLAFFATGLFASISIAIWFLIFPHQKCCTYIYSDSLSLLIFLYIFYLVGLQPLYQLYKPGSS